MGAFSSGPFRRSLPQSSNYIWVVLRWWLNQVRFYSSYKALRRQEDMVLLSSGYQTQRVHVGIWYILRGQRGSHIPTLRPKYIPYSYMDPLGEYPLGAHEAKS